MSVFGLVLQEAGRGFLALSRRKSVKPIKTGAEQGPDIIIGQLMDVNCTCFIDVRRLYDKSRGNWKNMFAGRGKL